MWYLWVKVRLRSHVVIPLPHHVLIKWMPLPFKVFPCLMIFLQTCIKLSIVEGIFLLISLYLFYFLVLTVVRTSLTDAWRLIYWYVFFRWGPYIRSKFRGVAIVFFCPSWLKVFLHLAEVVQRKHFILVQVGHHLWILEHSFVKLLGDTVVE